MGRKNKIHLGEQKRNVMESHPKPPGKFDKIQDITSDQNIGENQVEETTLEIAWEMLQRSCIKNRKH